MAVKSAAREVGGSSTAQLQLLHGQVHVVHIQVMSG